MDFFSKLGEELSSGKIRTRKSLEKRKRELVKELGLGRVPLNTEILARVGHHPLLVTKPVRTLSGVSVVAVMTKPQPCPGECIYCPRGEAAQSYTGFEPAAMRARQQDFDAAKQVSNRLRQLREAGHPTDKVELIVMGGTFTAMPADYQEMFMLGAFNALNQEPSRSIESAHEINESARNRCVGLTFEVR
ncbi:MAG: tRNA uridine(34) 5-carboxymethylaminomethyl modification radical SAM/GNAT enzyme Elp3, partial [Candidatus Diapherotrites archaeon]|nr:tRNA uridine(34) 5-carboxymethylaminomethyl modification radical SAM/GNAT enzyme Elp3 [Candidatus Diapherotrites archaeon]